MSFLFFFFFSSRRRHTRSLCDWSSDVCSSDLFRLEQVSERPERVLRVVEFLASPEAEPSLAQFVAQAARDHGVAFADFYCSSARAARGLERIGFKLAPTAAEAPAFPCRLQPLEG